MFGYLEGFTPGPDLEKTVENYKKANKLYVHMGSLRYVA